MNKIIYLVIAIFLLGCTGRTLRMEFESLGRNATYKLFDDSTYCVVAADSIAETGKLRINGDTIFLLKNVNYNITINHEVLFLIEDDSICRLELKEKQIPHGARDLTSYFEGLDIYEYFKKDCVVLKVISNNAE